MTMDLKYRKCSGLALFLLLVYFHRECHGQICSLNGSMPIDVPEDSKPGRLITEIIVSSGVTLSLTDNKHQAFELQGTSLFLIKELDYEALTFKVFDISIQCAKSDGTDELTLKFYIQVINVNDNTPQFGLNSSTLYMKELTPVGESIGIISATDADAETLYYDLDETTNGSEYFHLSSMYSPNILVKKVVYYNLIQTLDLVLYVRDTQTPGVSPSHIASTTITVIVQDVDNRPPWFQPCQQITAGSDQVCLNSGYTGNVKLTVKEEGVLQLKPGPLYAIDGDTEIKETIVYEIVGGNEAGIFAIDAQTGNITMSKATDISGPIILNIMASQSMNRYQSAFTSVTFNVVSSSLNPPKFEHTLYQGFISSDSERGSMVLEDGFNNKPLKVIAKDVDFNDGINPDVTYAVQGSSDFTVTREGFILISQDLTPGQVALTVTAEDTMNGEQGSTKVSVEVLKGTTTAMPTTNATDFTESATTIPSEITTNFSSGTSQVPTSEPNQTTLSPSPTHTDVIQHPAGMYSAEEMAAVSASLAVLLVLCMVVIGLLVFRIYKGKLDWKKLSEASIFRSSFIRGSNAKEDGMQFVNGGYKHEEDDASSLQSKVPDEVDIKSNLEHVVKVSDVPLQSQAVLLSAALASEALADTSSLADSDKADSEKEVKPILTKERRNEDGYKSVWFKEDIDPNAKEEVVIIPDSREGEADEDEESLDEDDEAEEEENTDPEPYISEVKVSFEDPETGIDKDPSVRFQDPDSLVKKESQYDGIL
ncbi:cadherin-related family member 5 isoform X2 [Amia ocellicauda]|uniref:cadherin-related family member 5 isoform X2 n=1 Tax=Amia ocellicauda TaxID=2972642 RepID=UPI0034641091